MTQLSKKEKRNTKIDNHNKRRRSRVKKNVFIATGVGTSFFCIVEVLMLLISNESIAAIISLIICIGITKLIFLNRKNKVKYGEFILGFLLTPTLLLLGVWDKDSSIVLMLCWIIICIYIVNKIYEKL